MIKAEVVKKVVMPVLIHGSEAWTTTGKHKSKITSCEMRFLRRIENKTRRDYIRNDTFRNNLNTKAANVLIQEGQLRWLGHLSRMDQGRTTKKAYEARGIGQRSRGRPRKSWNEEVKRAAEERNIRWANVGSLSMNRKQW